MFRDKAKTCLEAFDYLVGAWLFGSRASGRSHADSDVDIAVLSSEPLTLDQRLELQEALEVALKRGQVDVVDLQNAGPVLRFEALQGQRLLVRSEDEIATFSSLVGREYESTMGFIKLGYRYRKELNTV